MIARLLFVLALLTGACLAQGGNTVTIYASGAPTGSCSFLFQYIDSVTGNQYNCKAGAWNQIGGGGGSTAFSAITGATNTSAAMIVGSGASLATSGTGTIAATSIAGGPTYSTVTTPAAPTLATNGSAGSTTITYKIVGCQDTACTLHTAASSATSITTANATLSATNNVNISLYGVYGVQCYNVYRTAAGGTPSTTGLVGTCVSQTYKDIGGAGDSSTAPTTNTTVLVSNPWQLPGAAIPEGGPIGIDAQPASPAATDEECNETSFTPNTTITTTAGWYWVNKSTATISAVNGQCVIQISSGADNIFAIVEPVAGATWTYTARISTETFANFGGTGLYIYESATTKGMLFPIMSNAGDSQIQIYPFSVPTTRGATLTGALAWRYGGTFYMRIQYDGTNLKFSMSTNGDGQNFYQVFSEAVTTHFTTKPDMIGLGINAQGAAIVTTGVMDWLRKTQ